MVALAHNPDPPVRRLFIVDQHARTVAKLNSLDNDGGFRIASPKGVSGVSVMPTERGTFVATTYNEQGQAVLRFEVEADGYGHVDGWAEWRAANETMGDATPCP